MTVIVTIEIRVSDKGMDVNSIERSVEGVLEEARPMLWQVFVEAVENPLIDGGGVAKQRRRERTLMTTGGGGEILTVRGEGRRGELLLSSGPGSGACA